MTEEKKTKKSPAPVKYYAIVSHKVDDSQLNVESEVAAESKSELYKALEGFNEPLVLLLVRGRRIDLKQKVHYKI